MVAVEQQFTAAATRTTAVEPAVEVEQQGETADPWPAHARVAATHRQPAALQKQPRREQRQPRQPQLQPQRQQQLQHVHPTAQQRRGELARLQHLVPPSQTAQPAPQPLHATAQ